MTKPENGDVWRYDYLWKWQHDALETEGRKPRPVAFVAVVVGKDGATNLFILPITSKVPDGRRASLEIPQMECRRAGLDTDRPLWLLLDEYNHDVCETSYYLDPKGRLGGFSSAFHKQVLTQFLGLARANKTKQIPRHDS